MQNELLLGFLGLLASSMSVAVARLLKWSAEAATKMLDAAISVYLLAMMTAMSGGAVIYLLAPTTTSLTWAIALNMSVMMGGAALVGGIMISRGLEGTAAADTAVIRGAKTKRAKAFIPTVIVLVFVNEFLMGLAFILAYPFPNPAFQLSDPLMVLASVVSSFWFIFTMSAEMLLTVLFLRRYATRNLLFVLILQSTVMFFSPTAISNPVWSTIGIYASSSLMVVLFVFIFEHLARNHAIDSNLAGYYLRLLTVYCLMMGGLFVWELEGNALLFSVGVIAGMVVYFHLILTPQKMAGAEKKSWLDTRWVFAIISLTFVSEFLMGGVLDLAINPDFVGGMGLAPLGGDALIQFGTLMYDLVIGFGAVTASPQFLAMMGLEMGALVTFRIRRVRELETRIRLALVILAYAVYSVLLPSLVFPPQELARLPLVGWSMGIGTSGPVAPALLVALGSTYLVSGALSLLFGSRQLCSVLCTAALMYQGTFYDAMKTFNRTSRTARRFLTSKISNLFKATMSVVWISLVVASTISYLDSIGTLHLNLLGSDPTRFLYSFYFNFLWYVIFVSIPFVGTYACVTTGYCHWGTFNQFVSRLGLFRLRVKSIDACLRCPTKDCAKACPVGLTDLPGHFIASGEFKSYKCIGVGNCVSSCPYSNISFYDVRNWTRERLGRLREVRPRFTPAILRRRKRMIENR